jgi:glutathione S-transferase
VTISARELAGDKYILWGASWSLYTAKVRPFLIKKGIEYLELNPNHPHYEDKILPQIGHFTVPVLEMPNGDIIADSYEIMEYLDTVYPDLPLMPEDKTLAGLAQLIHSYGSEGLTKPAMYFRWNTTIENRVSKRAEFGRTIRSPEIVKEFSDSMRGFLPILGITLDHATDVVIEESTDKLYDVLNAHFQEYPYILGGVPSLADYGMMGALYAHHSRDISSANRMKVRAPSLYRWIEHMLRAQIVDAQVWGVPQEFFSVDNLPDTLIALLKLIADDYVPEIKAAIDTYHQWLEADERDAGAVVDAEDLKRCHQVLGMMEHVQGGVTIKRVALLDPVSHHLRFQALVDGMSDSEKDKFSGALDKIGAPGFIDLHLKRDMKRDDFAYVLI